MVIANGHDSGCRDCYGHGHAPCALSGDAEGYDRLAAVDVCEGCGLHDGAGPRRERIRVPSPVTERRGYPRR